MQSNFVHVYQKLCSLSHVIALPLHICSPSPSSPPSLSCVGTSTTTTDSRGGGDARMREDLRFAGSSEVRSTADIETSGGAVRVQVGLKYLSCIAITAMKIAGGIRLTMRERRELIPYFLNPMLLNLHKYVYQSHSIHIFTIAQSITHVAIYMYVYIDHLQLLWVHCEIWCSIVSPVPQVTNCFKLIGVNQQKLQNSIDDQSPPNRDTHIVPPPTEHLLGASTILYTQVHVYYSYTVSLWPCDVHTFAYSTWFSSPGR